MMRHFAMLLLVAVTGLSATETPLVMQQIGGEYQIVVNPGTGTATLYRDEINSLRRLDSINFVADILRLQKTIMGERGGKPINALQTGSLTNEPRVEDMLLALPNQPTPKETADGVPSYQGRARAGEIEFWTKEPKFDGVVWGAFSSQVLMLVVPSLRTAIFYDVRAPRIVQTPLGWRNYGADCYIPQVYRSVPLPQNLLRQLPPEVQEEFTAALLANAEALAGAANKALTLKASEVWVGAGSNDRFMIIDYANNRVISYDLSTRVIRLSGVRNIEIDLLVPNIFRASPDSRVVLQEFLQDPTRKAFIDSQGFNPFDLFMLKAIASSTNVAAGGKVSPVHATVTGNRNSDRVMVDFHNARKVVTYALQGTGNQLELGAVRDYTIDSALAALDAQINDRVFARGALAQAQALVANKQKELALTVLASALNYDPGLHKVIEKDANLVKALGPEPAWQTMIDEATKDATAREAARVGAIKGAQLAREEAAKKKAGK